MPASFPRYRDKSAFQGTFELILIHHCGHYRQPNAASWVTGRRVDSAAGGVSTWSAIAASIRRALAVRGWVDGEIEETLSALRPIVAAVERAGTRIDEDVAWALLAAEADRMRRSRQAAATRRAG